MHAYNDIIHTYYIIPAYYEYTNIYKVVYLCFHNKKSIKIIRIKTLWQKIKSRHKKSVCCFNFQSFKSLKVLGHAEILVVVVLLLLLLLDDDRLLLLLWDGHALGSRGRRSSLPDQHLMLRPLCEMNIEDRCEKISTF